ncbi:MAG: lipoate--protein ligase, partial [Planctomycetota bacterium]
MKDSSADGAWNMSVDQALLNSVDETRLPTLRFYRWQPATLSLGYFQDYTHRETHKPSIHCDCVRRASGGGAILHDRELTYSLILPTENRWADRNTDIYQTVHQAITKVFRDLQIELKTCENSAREDFKNNRFLCFERRADGDLLLDEFKVVGSAQRRSKKSILQHGSILLYRSEFAPELPGIFDLTNKQPVRELDVQEQLISVISDALSYEPVFGQL